MKLVSRTNEPNEQRFASNLFDWQVRHLGQNLYSVSASGEFASGEFASGEFTGSNPEGARTIHTKEAVKIEVLWRPERNKFEVTVSDDFAKDLNAQIFGRTIMPDARGGVSGATSPEQRYSAVGNPRVSWGEGGAAGTLTLTTCLIDGGFMDLELPFTRGKNNTTLWLSRFRLNALIHLLNGRCWSQVWLDQMNGQAGRRFAFPGNSPDKFLLFDM